MTYVTRRREGRILRNSESLSDSTFRAGPLVNIPALLVELGCDPGPIFERAGFDLDLLKDTEHRVSYLAANRLLEECVAASGCDHFGLELGQMASPSYLGVAGFLVRAASTVGQALKALVKNLDLHDDGATCTLRVEADYARLTYHVHQPGITAISHVHDLATAVMCNILRSICGKDWNASQVLLVRMRPPDMTPYVSFFRTTPLFNSEACAIVFPSACLKLTPPAADALLYQHLELEANALHQMQHRDIVDSLPALLQKGLLINRCSVHDIADALGIHERTLHRRLRSASTTFRQELDTVRESLSVQLLGISSLPICDIATSMGYADSSGFIRAFHRWTGSSPASWRKHKSVL